MSLAHPGGRRQHLKHHDRYEGFPVTAIISSSVKDRTFSLQKEPEESVRTTAAGTVLPRQLWTLHLVFYGVEQFCQLLQPQRYRQARISRQLRTKPVTVMMDVVSQFCL